MTVIDSRMAGDCKAVGDIDADGDMDIVGCGQTQYTPVRLWYQ